MTYWAKLNLPENPLRNPEQFIDTHAQFDASIVKEELPSVLNDSVLESFQHVGLDVQCVMVFRYYNQIAQLSNRKAHIDVTWQTQWQPLCFAVNWELGDDRDATMYWYAQSNDTLQYIPTQMQQLCPAQYVWPAYCGMSNSEIPVDQTKLSSALLVRTDVPHRVLFDCKRRLAISVKFKQLWSWSTAWDQLVKP